MSTHPVAHTAAQRFEALDNLRSTLKTRCEHYSGLTLPYIMPPEQYQNGDYELRHDHHSVGAQAVNHLANKLVLGLFQPGFPFFKLELDDKLKNELTQREEIEAADIDHSLAQGEKSALKAMAKHNLRPKLFEAVKQLVITGNALPVFHRKDDFELVGMRDFVVKRSRGGVVLEIVTRNRTEFSALSEDVQKEVIARQPINDRDHKVTHYHWITRVIGGEYTVSQWVDEHRLSSKYDSKYKEYSRLPWQPQAWTLPSRHDYGVGLVEEYVGDLTSITEYAESLSDGAALASVWRFLANPNSQIRAEDVADGDNGDVLPGTKDELTILSTDVSRNMTVVDATMQQVIQRFSRGFLLMDGVTRDAERVTATEIRALANELETGLGGVYSRLAESFQLPLAHFLLQRAEIQVEGTDIEPIIITGFDALSRAAELERLQLFLQDVANITSLPPDVQDWLKVGPLLRALAANRHLNAGEYVNTEDKVQEARTQRAQALQAQQMQDQGAIE